MRQHQPKWKPMMTVIVAVTSVITLAAYRVLGVIDWEGVWVGATKITVVAFFVSVFWEQFRKRCWRWPWLRGWLVDCPDIAGTWKGHAVSNFDDSKPIPVTVTIKQTFTSVNVSFRTDGQTSVSNSITASLVSDEEAGRCRLIYTYANEPNPMQNVLDMHFGTAILEIEECPAHRMRGTYMTARHPQTKGTIELERVTGSAHPGIAAQPTSAALLQPPVERLQDQRA